MRFEPECARRESRIGPNVPPPCGFIAAAMDFAMVPSAQWNGVLITDLATECSALGKAEVVGIGGAATANQARVLRNSSHVIAVAYPARLWPG